MSVDLPINSRFRFTSIVEHRGNEMPGSWPGFDWRQRTKVIKVSARFAGRLDLIANEYFGSPDYWWAIMFFNNVTDVNWPRAGDSVRLPRTSDVLSSDDPR